MSGTPVAREALIAFERLQAVAARVRKNRRLVVRAAHMILAGFIRAYDSDMQALATNASFF